MTRAATERCRAIIKEAQDKGACCFATDKNMQRQLARMAKRGELTSPLPGLYADAALWSRLKPDKRAYMIIHGLAAKHPNWVFCGMSAALIHGLWVSYHDLRKIHVACARGRENKQDSPIRWHKMKVSSVEVDGIRVTTLERTVFDCARLHPVRSSLGVADSALRMTGNDNAWLRGIVSGFGKRWHGWRTAAYVSSIANGLAENGGESRARATMIMLGYQVPQLQVELRNPIDHGTYRADFFWNLPNGTQVAGELDGRDKYALPEMTGGRSAIDVLRDERLRESRINALRIPVMRFSLADIYSTKRLSRIMDAFGIPKVAKRKPQALRHPRIVPDTEMLEIDGWTIELLVEHAFAA